MNERYKYTRRLSAYIENKVRKRREHLRGVHRHRHRHRRSTNPGDSLSVGHGEKPGRRKLRGQSPGCTPAVPGEGAARHGVDRADTQQSHCGLRASRTSCAARPAYHNTSIYCRNDTTPDVLDTSRTPDDRNPSQCTDEIRRSVNSEQWSVCVCAW